MLKCPLCDNEMVSLYNREGLKKQKGFHYWCDSCDHGWYISDMRNIVGNNLAYTVSNGKSPDEIRDVILKKDAEAK